MHVKERSRKSNYKDSVNNCHVFEYTELFDSLRKFDGIFMIKIVECLYHNPGLTKKEILSKTGVKAEVFRGIFNGAKEVELMKVKHSVIDKKHYYKYYLTPKAIYLMQKIGQMIKEIIRPI